MPSQALCKTALNLPAIPLLLGAEMAKPLGLKARAAHAAGGMKNRRLYRRMQEIE